MTRWQRDPVALPDREPTWADGFLLGVSLSALLGLLSFALAWAVFS